MSDTDYATYIKFLVLGPLYKSKLPGPSSSITPELYLVLKDVYDPTNPPFKYELFNQYRHVYPDVFWFQPYSKNPGAINYALTLGLLIESGDLDGVTISTPSGAKVYFYL